MPCVTVYSDSNPCINSVKLEPDSNPNINSVMLEPSFACVLIDSSEVHSWCVSSASYPDKKGKQGKFSDKFLYWFINT